MFDPKMTRRNTKALAWAATLGGTAIVALASVGLRHQQSAWAGLVYTSHGYGGYVAAQPPRPQQPLTPIRQLTADYNAGHYAAVETNAEALLAQQGDADSGKRRVAAQAGLLWAYTAARQKNYPVAAERFALARNIAASLPDHGAAPFHYGDAEPSVEEEAAFQHAVCVGAEGRKPEAEAEYRDFMRSYRESILIHAAVKRIARNHGGDIPKDAEALWQQSMQFQRKQDQARERERSLCGPECLKELLARRGTHVQAHALAAEMRTDERGTTLAALAETAQEHGFTAQGVQLSQQGLAQQKLPAVAFLNSGHYVLVDHVAPSGAVTVWDPDAQGVGKAGIVYVTLPQWQQAWSGIALAVK